MAKTAIAELSNGLAHNGIRAFHIAAIVGADNVAPQQVAAATISPDATPDIDQYSGIPVFQYVRKIEAT